MIPSYITIIECEQRSAAWAAARIARATGSCASDICAMEIPPEFTPTGRVSKAKPKERAGRKHLRTRLVLEKIMGRSLEPSFLSAAMQQGIDREWDALLAYEALSGRIVRHVGFLSHNELMVGGSPDGYLGDFDVIVEAKSPLPATHLEYLETGIVPSDYLKQLQHYLWLTGAKACDWFSYNPDFPEPLQVKLVRVERDEAAIADYESKVTSFLAEVDQKIATLRQFIDLKSTLRAAAAESAVA